MKLRWKNITLLPLQRDFSFMSCTRLILRIIAEWKAIVTATTAFVASWPALIGDGNSELARIYLRSAWRRNSSRSKYDRPASILIWSGGLRASERFPRGDYAWVAADPKRWAAFASHTPRIFRNFFLLSAKYGWQIISMFDLA